MKIFTKPVFYITLFLCLATAILFGIVGLKRISSSEIQPYQIFLVGIINVMAIVIVLVIPSVLIALFPRKNKRFVERLINTWVWISLAFFAFYSMTFVMALLK